MAKKRKLEPKPVPVPVVELESEPEPEEEEEDAVEEEEEEEEEDDAVEEEEEVEEDDPVEEEPEEEEEEDDDDDDEEEEDSSDDDDDNPNPNGSTAVDNPNPNGSTPVDPISVRDLLASLSKDQLVSLLTSAAVSHPSVLKEIQTTADEDPSYRRLFVYHLSFDTTADSLKSFFSQYGTVEGVNNSTDRLTGNCKGYALVLFQTRAAAQNALKEPLKMIGSRMSHCRLDRDAVVSAAPTVPVSDSAERRIYVSNVMPDIDPRGLLEFFQQFGEIENGPLGLDRVTGKPKGYAMFIYKTVEGAKRALEQQQKSYAGHFLHCSMAVDKPKLVGKVQMSQTNNNFVGGAPSPAVAPPARHLAPQTVQPVGPQVMPALATNAALGQAVGQALTALGFANPLGGLGGGVQAPAVANPVVPSVQGGYTAGMPVQGGYDARAPVRDGYAAGAAMQGGYAARAPVQGGYAAGAPVQGGYDTRAPVQGGYDARAPVQGGYAAGAPVQDGYAARAPVQDGYVARAPVQDGYAVRAPVPGGYVAGAPVHGAYDVRAPPVHGAYDVRAPPVHGAYDVRAPVQGGYAAGAPVQGGYDAGTPVQGGYTNQGRGQGGAGSGYPHGGIGSYGIGGYGNHASYR